MDCGCVMDGGSVLWMVVMWNGWWLCNGWWECIMDGGSVY